MHSAIPMARRQVPAMMPRELVWPFDCTRRCNEYVPVPIGPAVADEMTRNLRGPYRDIVRGNYGS